MHVTGQVVRGYKVKKDNHHSDLGSIMSVASVQNFNL